MAGIWLMWGALVSAEVPEPPRFEGQPEEYGRAGGEFCFPSGLRVTVLSDRRQPVVSVTAVVGRGADADPAGREGAAHLLEHLWFRARPDGGAPVADILRSLGARHNAFTLADATVYTTVGDVAGLSKLMALEGARLTDPLAGIDAALLAQEAEIVRSELRLSGFNLADQALLLPADLHGSERPLRPSTPSSVAAITADDLREVAGHYAPEHTTLLVRGDVDVKAVLAVAKRTLPEALREPPAGAAPRTCGAHRPTTDANPPALPARDPRVVRVDIDEPRLIFGWSLPPAWAADDARIALATTVVEDAIRARLRERRVEYSWATCRSVPGAWRSSLLCRVSVPVGAPAARAREAVLEAVQSAPDDLDAAELGDLAFALRSEVALGVEALSPLWSDLALDDALANHFSGGPSWFLDVLDGFDQVGVDELAAFTKAWVNPRNARVTLLLREGADEAAVWAGRNDRSARITADDGASSLTQDDTAEATQPSHHAPTELGAPSGAPITAARAPRPLSWTLPNGLSVVLVPHGDVPVVQAGLVVGGGPLREPRLGLDDWAWEVLRVSDWGVPNASYRYAAQLLGARIWAHRGLHDTVIGTTGPSGSLPGQLWLLRAFGEGAYMPPNATTHQHIRVDIQTWDDRRRVDPGVALHEARRAHLLGASHPLAFDGTARTALGADAGFRELKRYIANTWQPANATLVIVGAMDPLAVRDEVDRWFGTWQPPKKAVPPVVPSAATAPAPQAPGAWFAVDPERALSRVVLECRLGPATAATESVAEERAREEVWRRVRESDLGAYDPAAQVWGGDDARVLWLAATVATDRAGATATALAEVVAALAAGAGGPEATSRARTQLAASWSAQFVEVDPLFWWTVEHGELLDDFVQARPAELRGVTPEAVAAAFQPCAAAPALSIVGPAAAPFAGTPWAATAQEVRARRAGW